MGNDTFDFITPKTLQRNITESIEFAGWLWVVTRQVDKEYKDEMVRTIVLYNIGIIESLLLFRAKKVKLKFHEDVYSNTTSLPAAFQHTTQELTITYKSKRERPEARIWLNVLLKEQKKFLGIPLYEVITDLQNIRNTFHLSKPRRVLSLNKAQNSFDVVLNLAEKIRKEFP